MSFTIQTKKLAATSTRPTRVRAVNDDGESFIRTYDYGNTFEEHRLAAEGLAKKLGWTGEWNVGGSIDGKGYVFVRIDEPVLKMGIPKD